jgi:phosphate transport system permease protein
MPTITLTLLLAALLALVVVAYATGFGRSLSLARRAAPAGRGLRLMHSLPEHYGAMVAVWCGLPSLLLVLAWIGLEGPLVSALVTSSLPESLRNLPPDRLDLVLSEVQNVAHGVVASGTRPALTAAAHHWVELLQVSRLAMVGSAMSLAVAGTLLARRRIRLNLRARNEIERVLEVLLAAASSIAILTTIGIVLSVLFEAMRFFQTVSVFDFLFGLKWSPQTAIRADQVGASGAFGAVPLFAGTLLISGIALATGAPLGLFSAIYLAEYATTRQRALAKPALEILAGIPTVVYGFFAALTVAPWLRGLGERVGLGVSSESALAAGLVMGIMLVPFVSSLSDDVITAVPQALRDGSYGLGATRAETIRKVVLPAALPGIVGSLLLAVSRAIGETMIVVMAAGLAAHLTANPFETVTTVTVQIVTLLIGDQEFDSPKTLAAFALGLVLFAITLGLNAYALYVVRRYREQYD